MAEYIIHFWEAEGALCDILPVTMAHNAGDAHLAKQAWSSVLAQIFPIFDRGNGRNILWRVQREAHLGDRADQWRERPVSIMTYRVFYAPTRVAMDMRDPFKRDDWILMQIKPPGTNSAECWRDLLEGTSSRLARYRPQSQMFVICAIGLHYMMFFWEPSCVVGPAAAVRGRVWSNHSQSGPVEYILPRQFQPIPPAPHIPNFNPAGPNTGPLWIDHTRALSIHPDPTNNIIGLTSLKNYLVLARTLGLGMQVFGNP